MKLNPKLDYFIQNKITSSAENRHILFEDSDLINVEKLILETATSDEIKENCLGSAKENCNGTYMIHCLPFWVIYRILDDLLLHKKEKGRTKIMKTLYKYFPNWDQIELADTTSKIIVGINNQEEYLQSNYKELFGGKTNER